MQHTLDRRDGEGTVKHYLQQLTVGFEHKVTLSVFGVIISGITGFYGDLLWGFLALFVLDLISGILKAKKKGEKISSRRLRDSVTKLGAYMVLITALIITGRYQPEFQPVITGAYCYFMFTELKSIFENVEEMGLRLPSAVSFIIKSKIIQSDPGKAVEAMDKEDKEKKEDKDNDKTS
jgi:phage-related holin